MYFRRHCKKAMPQTPEMREKLWRRIDENANTLTHDPVRNAGRICTSLPIHLDEAVKLGIEDGATVKVTTNPRSVESELPQSCWARAAFSSR